MKKINYKLGFSLIAAALAVASLALVPAISSSQTQTGTTLQLSSLYDATNSARAIGLGGASMTLVDEQSVLHNPAAVGIYHLSKSFGATLPNSRLALLNKTSLQTWNISAGRAVIVRDEDGAENFRFSYAAAYASTSTRINAIENRDKSLFLQGDFLSLSVAFEKGIRVGLGASLKMRDIAVVERDYTASAYYTCDIFDDSIYCGDSTVYTAITREETKSINSHSFDFGVIIEAPYSMQLGEADADDEFALPDDRKMNLEFTPSLAFVKSSISRKIDLPYSIAPNSDGFDYIAAGFKMALVESGFTRLGVNMIIERQKESAVNNSSLISAVTRYGVELEIEKAIFLRTGWNKNPRVTYFGTGLGNTGTVTGGIIQGGSDYSSSSIRPLDEQSFGLGLRLSGIIRMFSKNKFENNGESNSENNSENASGFLHGLDVSLDYGDNRVNRSVMSVSLSASL